jgi:hypothetical protein
MQLLLTGDDFLHRGNQENLLFSGIVLFVVLFAIEFLSYTVFTLLWSSDEILKSATVRRRIARNITESASMMFMAWLGYANFIDLGGFEPFVAGVGAKQVRMIPIR